MVEALESIELMPFSEMTLRWVISLCALAAGFACAAPRSRADGEAGWSSGAGFSSVLVQSVSHESVTSEDVADEQHPPEFASFEAELQNLRAAVMRLEQQQSASRITPAVVYPQVRVTGFFQADAGWVHQDEASRIQFDDIQDDRGFRRTRLAAQGKVAENVSYIIEMDFAFNGRPSFMDVWMDVAGVPLPGNLRVGQYRMPFGMDELTSVRELTFLERPTMFGLGPFRQVGAELHDSSADENFTWAAAVFGAGTDFWGNSIGDRGYGTAERLTAVVAEDSGAEFLVHVGAGHTWQATPNKLIQARNVPEFGGPLGVPGNIPFFIDTGALPADDMHIVNGELAATWGSVHAQSELRYAFVSLNNGQTATLPAFYTQVGYQLTGEHRPYNKANAVLGRIKPSDPLGPCGCGAWEIAARYSWIDFNEPGITGGELANVSGVLNWYLNDYAKFQFTYIHADLDRVPGGDSTTGIYGIRAQLDF